MGFPGSPIVSPIISVLCLGQTYGFLPSSTFSIIIPQCFICLVICHLRRSLHRKLTGSITTVSWSPPADPSHGPPTRPEPSGTRRTPRRGRDFVSSELVNMGEESFSLRGRVQNHGRCKVNNRSFVGRCLFLITLTSCFLGAMTHHHHRESSAGCRATGGGRGHDIAFGSVHQQSSSQGGGFFSRGEECVRKERSRRQREQTRKQMSRMALHRG